MIVARKGVDTTLDRKQTADAKYSQNLALILVGYWENLLGWKIYLPATTTSPAEEKLQPTGANLVRAVLAQGSWWWLAQKVMRQKLW